MKLRKKILRGSANVYYCLISLNLRNSLGGIKTMLKGSKTDEKVASLKVKADVNTFA